MQTPTRVIAVTLLLTLVACSGNDEAQSLAKDIRDTGSPLVRDVLVDAGSWHENWGVIVEAMAGDSAGTRTLWCDVLLPAWNRRSLATRLGSSPTERLTVEVAGSPVDLRNVECP